MVSDNVLTMVGKVGVEHFFFFSPQIWSQAQCHKDLLRCYSMKSGKETALTKDEAGNFLQRKKSVTTVVFEGPKLKKWLDII